MSSLSSHFACDKFVIVSLTKNLYTNVRHMAALVFSFRNCQLSFIVNVVKTQVQSQNHRIMSKLFSLFVCSGSNLMWKLAGSNRVNRLYTENCLDIGILTYFWIQILRPINEYIIFQRSTWAFQNFISLSIHFAFCDYNLNLSLKIVLTFMVIL